MGSTGYAERFFDRLADDFNTPAARAVLFEWVREANRRLDAGEAVGVGRAARRCCTRWGSRRCWTRRTTAAAPTPRPRMLLRARGGPGGA